MGLFEHWPYVNFHDLNLDWIIKEIPKVYASKDEAQASAEASAESAAASQLSADAALASQEAAHQSELNAAQSEENAADSEESAKNYADHIADPVSGLVTNWLNENITPTTPIVDKSLSISGAAADALVTGFEINSVASFSNIKNESVSIEEIEGTPYTSLPLTYKWVIAELPEKCVLNGLTLCVQGNSDAIVKLQKWVWSDNQNGYVYDSEITGTISGQFAQYYRLSFDSFVTDTRTLLTYSDTSSAGWVLWKQSAEIKLKRFPLNLNVVTENDIVQQAGIMMHEISYSYFTQTKNTVTVDANGNGDYLTVIEAVNKEPEGTVIRIMPGVYEGTVQAFQKRIILIGTDRNKCILKSTDGRYGYPAINGSCGYLENLTIVSEYVNGVSNEIDSNTSGAYAFHCENEYGSGDILEFHHCTLKSDFFPALGTGLRKDFHLIIDDCELQNNQIIGRGAYSNLNDGSLGALYFHDSNGEQGDQFITVKDCLMKSSLGTSMTPYQVAREPQNNHVYCEFINNVLYDSRNGYENNIWYRGDPFNTQTGVFDITIGFGNSNNGLNNN